MRRGFRLAAVLAALSVGTLGGAGGAYAAVPSGNLLQNPGAEEGGGGGSPPPPPWSPANGFAVESYGAENFPDATVGNSIGGGANFFAGGSEQDISYATQTIDVSSAAAEIDAGEVSAALAGWLGGYADEGDHAQVTADAQPSDSGAPFTTFVRMGPITASDRNNQTALLKTSATGKVPVGTRRIRVTIISTRLYGTYTDGYADNLTLVLTHSPGGVPDPPGDSPPTTISLSTKLTIERKRFGRRFTGRVTAESPCKSDRTVTLRKPGPNSSTKTSSSGHYQFDLNKKVKKGKASVRVKTRTRTVNGTTYTCGSKSSKDV